MRMWMINPKVMCRKHLLGEHVELHMLVGSIKKRKSIKGFIDNKLVSPFNIDLRHRQLVEEILSRGYNHKSDLEMLNQADIDFLYDWYNAVVDVEANIIDLSNRCEDCKQLMIVKE